MDKTVPTRLCGSKRLENNREHAGGEAERMVEGGGRKWIEKVGKVAAQHVS